VVAGDLREAERLGVQRRELGIRVAHHVAVDVAARGQRVEEGAVDLVDQGPKVALEDAVQLERLARGELERAVGVRAGG